MVRTFLNFLLQIDKATATVPITNPFNLDEAGIVDSLGHLSLVIGSADGTKPHHCLPVANRD